MGRPSSGRPFCLLNAEDLTVYKSDYGDVDGKPAALFMSLKDWSAIQHQFGTTRFG
jgi:hypothetical protein